MRSLNIPESTVDVEPEAGPKEQGGRRRVQSPIWPLEVGSCIRNHLVSNSKKGVIASVNFAEPEAECEHSLGDSDCGVCMETGQFCQNQLKFAFYRLEASASCLCGDAAPLKCMAQTSLRPAMRFIPLITSLWTGELGPTMLIASKLM